MSKKVVYKTLKLLVIGNSMVGKSSILLRYCDGEFNDDLSTTIGVDFRFKTLEVTGKPIKLQIWDTAGQERFRTITGTYYRKADGIMVVYDITNEESFKQISTWFKEIKKHAPPNVAKILVANKIDLQQSRVISQQQGQELAKSYNCSFFEVSAKSGEGVEKSFENLAEITFKNLSGGKNKKKKQAVLSNDEIDKSGCC
ncbi:ras and ef-hand domain-containing protein [Anaeramoeba ignava]|uniref:Ras and ef-hand domain-containing protein n=1 Tax=Anaeramoeba ignava TaxID=1746090 RepID=A0A9Q0LNB4_ANAIG|nr:ras and ef-hand domain-containing protein [Anaeramoeba ignava]